VPIRTRRPSSSVNSMVVAVTVLPSKVKDLVAGPPIPARVS